MICWALGVVVRTSAHHRQARARCLCSCMLHVLGGPRFTTNACLNAFTARSLACMPKGADGSFWVYDAVSKDWCAWAV